MQHTTQQQDIQSLAQRALERLERNNQCNTPATATEKRCNKQGSKSAHFVASVEQPQQPPMDTEKPSVYADPSQLATLATSKGSAPRLVVSNAQRISRRTGTKTKAFRIEIDGKSLTFINHSDTTDVRALINRKFGAERVGEIIEIGKPREKEEQS